MSQIAAKRVARLALVFTFSLSVVQLTLLSITWGDTDPNIYAFRGGEGLLGIINTTLGAVIVSRQPRAIVGWLVLWTGVSAAVVGFSEEYGTYALLYRETPAFGGELAAWVTDWLWVPSIAGILPFAFLYFPDNRLPGERWRWALRFAVLGTTLMTFAWAFVLQEHDAFPPFPNTFAIRAFADVEELVLALCTFTFAACLVPAVVSLFLRFRRSAGEQRQQIKWVFFTASMGVIFLTIPFTLPERIEAFEVIAVLSIYSIPGAIGIAMLRYGLYEIDVVINRTLVYVPLSALLAGLYVGGVGAFRTAFAETLDLSSDVSVAVMAIVVVALVTPVRNKFQTFVDKHFKETADPAKAINGLADDLDRVLQVFDADRVAKRFVDHVAGAVGAKQATLKLSVHGASIVQSVGDSEPPPVLVVPIHDGVLELGDLTLGPRANARAYSERERESIERAADLLARALHVATSASKPAPAT